MAIASPWNHRVHEKEGEKLEKYQELKREIKNIWGIRHVEVVPIVVGALGGVSKRLDGWVTKLWIAIKKGLLQKTALLGTARKDPKKGSRKLNKRGMTQRTFGHWLWLAPLV